MSKVREETSPTCKETTPGRGCGRVEWIGIISKRLAPTVTTTTDGIEEGTQT